MDVKAETNNVHPASRRGAEFRLDRRDQRHSQDLRIRTKAADFLANSAVHFVLEVPSPTPPSAHFCELRLPVAAPHNTQCYSRRTQWYPLFAVVSPVVGMREGTSLSLLPLPYFAGPDRIDPWD